MLKKNINIWNMIEKFMWKVVIVLPEKGFQGGINIIKNINKNTYLFYH